MMQPFILCIINIFLFCPSLPGSERTVPMSQLQGEAHVPVVANRNIHSSGHGDGFRDCQSKVMVCKRLLFISEPYNYDPLKEIHIKV